MSVHTILVTGGAGYVGSHVIVELISAGYSTVIVDNRAEAIKECIEGIRLITDTTVPAYTVDLLDKDGLRKVFQEHKIDCVLHLAGLKAVRESHSQPFQYYKVNVIGSINLFEVMQEYDVYFLVFSSSSKVYGTPQYLPLDEQHPTGNCTNPYGRTKYMVEQILQDMCSINKKWNVTILRYFNPSGAHNSGKIGECRGTPPKNLMPCICHAALGKMKKFTVFGSDYDTSDGTAVKDYTHVMDLARGHVAAIKHLRDGGHYKVYNMGTGHIYSILEMIKMFEKISGKKVAVEMCGRKPGELGEVSSDSSKAYRELGWKAEKNLGDMCEDMWRWVTCDKVDSIPEIMQCRTNNVDAIANGDHVQNSGKDQEMCMPKKVKICDNDSIGH